MLKKILISVVLLLSFVAYGGYWLLKKTNLVLEEKIEIFVPTGADFNNILNQIEPYLKSKTSFEIASKLKGYSNRVKAGRYILEPCMNNTQIISVLRSGNKSVKVQFNNQERLETLAHRISQQIEADSTSLMKAFTDTLFLKQNGFSPEQALSMYIPNTYDIYWNTSAAEFRDRMLKEYHRFWNEDKIQKAENQGLNPIQVMILASIIQKETVNNSEKPTIAGVYLNRLKKGMLLQADPTVIFAIKNKTKHYDTIIKRVLYKDLDIDSPYNTYRNAGLPPAPITMPDISSIEAVLAPEQHNYLYFVADPLHFGYHKFASNLSQHNKNRDLYIQWIKKQGIQR